MQQKKKNCTPSPKRSPQGQQGNCQSKQLKKKSKAPKKQEQVFTQRTLKTTDNIYSQRSPGTRTTKQTMETKRSISPDTSKHKKNPKQSQNLQTPKKAKSKSRNTSPLQKYINEKRKSTILKEKELKVKQIEQQIKKQINLQKLERETKKIFQKPKKLKKKKTQKLSPDRVKQIQKKFEDISKRFEQVQYDQIQKFEQQVARQKPEQQDQEEMEQIYNYYINQAALIIQNAWRAYCQLKQNKNNKENKLSVDWEPQVVTSQLTSPSNYEDGFLFSQGGEKQVHISNIRSSIVSEDSQSIVHQLGQEFEYWSLQLQRIVKDQDITPFNKQVQQQIINIVQNHLKKSECLSDKRSEKEVLQEKSFNTVRKRLSDDLSKSNILQLQQQAMKKENELLSYREEAIYLRYDAEQKNLAEDDKQLLDDWLNGELEDLQHTKLAIEIGHRREISTLKKIQRDILIASSEFEDDSETSSKIQQIQKQIDEQFNVGPTKMERPQQEIYQTIGLISGEILNDVIHEFSEEVIQQKDQFEQLISQLIVNQIQAGVPTSVNDIQQYIENLFKYILENHQAQLIQNLNIPYGFTPIKRLQLIHGYDEDEENEQIDDQIAFPLDENLFLEYEQHRLQEEENSDENQYAMKELEHIHNKAIFDACNEALNYYRPYFLNSGITYPWQQVQIKSIPITTQQTINQLIQNMKKQVLDWSKILCGFLPIEDQEVVSEEKQQIIEEKNFQMLMQQLVLVENPLLLDANQQFDNLGLIRDEQLYKMLVGDIKESEYKWFLIEDDRTEFLMELSDQIFETLIEEFSREM